MLEINLFRNSPEIIRESLRRRFANVEVVDEIIKLDKDWRQLQFQLEHLRKEFNNINKQIAAKLKMSGGNATPLMNNRTYENKLLTTSKKKEVLEAKAALDAKLDKVENLIHDSVPEEDNAMIRVLGEKRTEKWLKTHVDLIQLIQIADMKKGGGGHYRKGVGVPLNQALTNYGLDFLRKRGFTALKTPSFMKKDVMAKCAQLAQFDQQLYKVTGEGDDKYLISTAQEPLCGYHMDDWIHPSKLPIRYAGYSSCFRKEAGSHGRDTLGIFRVDQFDELVQFCITSPNDNESWFMHEEVMKNSEEFYQTLNIPYRVINIMAGALNAAAAKKYDLEAWFPGSNAYRELASCSNCTDYQARRLGIRYGQKKSNKAAKQYVHMLNSTLMVTDWTLRCILENYQNEDGVEIPEVLRPYMRGKSFMPFQCKAELVMIPSLLAKTEVQDAEAKAKLETVCIHDSVPISKDEEGNAVIRVWGQKLTIEKFKCHFDLVELLGIVDMKKGADTAGHRGYYLKGDGARLNQALIKYGLDFLQDRGFTALLPPFLMKKDVMAKCAQLAQFHEELYKVNGQADEKYLIATAEQPLCAYRMGETIDPAELPIRYAGYSSCFRKEAGSHGRDTLGIFRVHEFEKVEQFCITSPNDNESWVMHEEMMKNSVEFYQTLNLPYRVIDIVSGLNDAAAKKYDLEAWFPGSNAYRELVSSSNCTDYQSRRLGIRYGLKESHEAAKQYVHLLNSTLTATERTICCILENYQKEDGVEIPQVLRPYMDGDSFIPFQCNRKNTK